MQLCRIAQKVKQRADILRREVVLDGLHSAANEIDDPCIIRSQSSNVDIPDNLLYIWLNRWDQMRNHLFSDFDCIVDFFRHLLLECRMGGLFHIGNAICGSDHAGREFCALLLHAGGRFAERGKPDGGGSVDERAGHHVIHLRAVVRGITADAQLACVAREEELHARIREGGGVHAV